MPVDGHASGFTLASNSASSFSQELAFWAREVSPSPTNRPSGFRPRFTWSEKLPDYGPPWLSHRSAMGDVFAIEKLGLWLLTSSTSQQAKSKGTELLNKAIHLGSLSAMHSFGTLLLDGPSVSDEDRIHGENLLRESSKHGYLNAATELGTRLLLGEGVQRDLKEGTELLERAARKGDLLAMVLLARWCGPTDYATISAQEARHWMLSAGIGSAADHAKVGFYVFYRVQNLLGTTLRQRFLHFTATLLAEAAASDVAAAAGLAYLVRRHEAPANRFSPLKDLLAPGVDANYPFAVANEALRLAAGIGCAVDWFRADELISKLNGSRGVLDWWLRLCRDTDPEGHLVIAWLVRHRLTVDPDRVSLPDRLELSRKLGWSMPAWMSDYAD